MTKKAETAVYEIALAKNFTLPQRYRAGFAFVPGEPQTLELTEEQVQEFKNDRYFVVSTEEEAATAKSQAENDEAADQEATQSEAKTEGATTEVATEKDGSELESLLQSPREELNSLAVEVGIAEPEKLANKTAVAEAIIAQRG